MVLNTGFLVCSVLDVVDYGETIAILDTSAACHMPDVLEMPYRPPVLGGDFPDIRTIRCVLADLRVWRDVIGDYSFDRPLKAGDKVILAIWLITQWSKTIPLTA